MPHTLIEPRPQLCFAGVRRVGCIQVAALGGGFLQVFRLTWQVPEVLPWACSAWACALSHLCGLCELLWPEAARSDPHFRHHLCPEPAPQCVGAKPTSEREDMPACRLLVGWTWTPRIAFLCLLDKLWSFSSTPWCDHRLARSQLPQRRAHFHSRRAAR